MVAGMTCARGKVSFAVFRKFSRKTRTEALSWDLHFMLRSPNSNAAWCDERNDNLLRRLNITESAALNNKNITYYNPEECECIRDIAEEKFTNKMDVFCNFNGIVGLINMFLLVLSLKLVERTLTLPVILSSMLDAINWLLFLPAAFCVFAGIFFSDHQRLQVEDVWLKYLYFVSGGALFTLALLGIFASKEKLRGLLKFYAGSMSLVVCLLAFACGSSFWFSFRIKETYLKEDLDTIACDGKFQGCSKCDDDDAEDKCPEWGEDVIIQFIQADFKLAGLFAAISCLFAVRATRASWILIANLKDYKCTYV